MEAHAQAVADDLIDSLHAKLRPGASHVINRRRVTFFPQGGNDYTPNGVKVIGINKTSDQWLDPSTGKLIFNVQNLDAALTLKPRTLGPWRFSRRVRVWVGGQICEDIDNYTRVRQLLHVLKPGEKVHQ